MRQVLGATKPSVFYNEHESLSDFDVLTLQELFLTPGFHTIRVDSLIFGRSLVTTFLRSLSCFSAIGYLSSACSSSLSHFSQDSLCFLEQDLLVYSAGSLSHDIIDRFMLENFYYDFVWIECTRELKSCDWFVYFCKRMQDFNIFTSVPVVFVYAQDEEN